MTYLQRLLDTAAAAPPNLGVGAGPPNAGQSPIFGADQRLAQFPDAAFDIGAEPLLPETTPDRPVENSVPVGRRENLPRFEAPETYSTGPSLAPSPPATARNDPAQITPSEQMPGVPGPAQISAAPRIPSSPAHSAKPPQPAEPVFRETAAEPAAPATTPADHPPENTTSSQPVAAPGIRAAALWPIPAADFQPAKLDTDKKSTSELRPNTPDRPQALPSAQSIPAEAPAVAPAPASPSPVQNGSPMANEPLEPTPPRAPVEATQPPPEKVIERAVERIVEKPAPTPPSPQTAESVSVIGPLKGLQPGRWRYFGGGF